MWAIAPSFLNARPGPVSKQAAEEIRSRPRLRSFCDTGAREPSPALEICTTIAFMRRRSGLGRGLRIENETKDAGCAAEAGWPFVSRERGKIWRFGWVGGKGANRERCHVLAVLFFVVLWWAQRSRCCATKQCAGGWKRKLGLALGRIVFKPRC